MKKSIVSLVSIMALSGMAYAGGDMTKVVEPVVEIPEVEVNPFYAGFGLGEVSVNNDTTDEEISSTTLMIQAGYQVNEYLAFEGRYSFGLGDSDYDAGNLTNVANAYDGDVSTWGVYVKPMYPIGEFSLYALLGYGEVMLDDLAGGDAVEGGFQWGVGASYAFTEEISIFADYVSLYDDTGFGYRAQTSDVDADAWTVGLSYNF
ncbi:porin family protein [Sulfurovum sp. XGS-02]|uniref:outer membrane protein n=1 Tax=Sulfurovum sp. XGS-02 TaxID=2925411 RepID=UPI002056712C|nr:porin family protein [Sulfurovum sp. XGS-02]UPT77358.1 porin family protein [Sulfurovum sp. XGS-02]